MTGDAVLACAREIKSADTEAVVAEFSSLLKSYGLETAYADRYGAEWARNAFERHGIKLRQSPPDRSALYLNLLLALNAGQIKLFGLPRLRSQLLALERRTIRGTARDVVDHPTAGADDLINACAGSLVLAATADLKKVHWYAASENWDQYAAEAAEGLTDLDRSRRAALGPDWRSKIAPSDPSYRPKDQQHDNT